MNKKSLISIISVTRSCFFSKFGDGFGAISISLRAHLAKRAETLFGGKNFCSPVPCAILPQKSAHPDAMWGWRWKSALDLWSLISELEGDSNGCTPVQCHRQRRQSEATQETGFQTCCTELLKCPKQVFSLGVNVSKSGFLKKSFNIKFSWIYNRQETGFRTCCTAQLRCPKQVFSCGFNVLKWIS